VPLPTPNLDTRRQADIVAEARALIPRYTPEWTDLNDSDPGLTLVQLYAWMTEMTLYRLNQVPELTYIKFLELLDVRLLPAEPARAELTFTLVDPPVAPIVDVPVGTRVAAAGGDGRPPVVFETDRALQALGARLAAVLSYDGFSYTQLTSTNETGDRGFEPFGPQAREGSALCLGFAFAGPFPAVALDLAVFVAAGDAPPQPAHCDVAAAAVVPPVELAWEYWDGERWSVLALDEDETRAFTRSGHVSLQVPGDRLALLALGDVPEPLYWLRARVARAGYELAPRLDTVSTNTVPATQAETVENEVLGGSDGLPDQTFALAFTPVLAASVVLEIDEGSGPRTWQEADDFFAAGPEDEVYTLDRATGVVTFGDGRRGRIPVANADSPAGSVRALVYRHGGGSAGNVPAGAIAQLQTAVDGVQAASNRRASEGGADEETLDDAKDRAGQELATRGRAVTAEDFAVIARLTPGVRIRRAHAIGLAHPGFPDVPIPGAVTVVVVPDGDAPNPLPSETTLQAVCRHLDQHRLLTTETFVVGPTYRLVKVEAAVRVHATADLGVVRRAVEDALTRWLHPLDGGEDGLGWPLGGTIFHSLVMGTALGADPGVARIDELWIWLDGERQPFCRDVAIGPRVLPYSDGHDIRVSFE
jgi:predicted phage baseplate assembly protein